MDAQNSIAKFRKSHRLLKFIFPLIAFGAVPASACPKIDGFIDYNCDQKIKIVFTGDSVVFGVGDSRNDGQGGYVKRIARRYKDFEIINQGYPGYPTENLALKLRKALSSPKNSHIKRDFAGADYLILDVGRNDYFTTNNPETTVSNEKKLVKFLLNALGKEAPGIAPIVAVAKLAPTSRTFQRSFIALVNYNLDAMKSALLPVRLAFDQIDVGLLSYDGLHPSSEGYDALADIVDEYLTTDAQHEAKLKRPDSDNDGVYDIAERRIFKTKVDTADTDEDGLSDGVELFTYRTDPLVADSDGDGFSDGAEITAVTDPLDPASFPVP